MPTTVALAFRAPALTWALVWSVGATPAMRGSPSSSIASASSRVTVCRPPLRTRPGGPPALPLEMVSRLVPRPLKTSVMFEVTPLPSEVRAMTAATPMITPRAVRMLRRALARIARQAMVKVSSGLRPLRLNGMEVVGGSLAARGAGCPLRAVST